MRPGARGPVPATDPYCWWVITGQTQSARLHVAASVGNMVQSQVARCYMYEGIAWASAGACMVQGMCDSHIRLLATPVARAYGPPRREHMAVFPAYLFECETSGSSHGVAQ